VNYADYDNDGDGYVDALFIIHAGPGYERTGNPNDIWSHKWEMQLPQHLDGVIDSVYSMEPEYWDDPGDITCGVYAHEMGHSVFGLPDLYDYDYDSRGLGSWSLMSGGSWNGPLGSSPAHPDAWSRMQMGAVVATILSADLLGASIPAIEETPAIFRLWTCGAVGDQYFLVENRRQTGYDTYLPDQGLLIYHVDQAVSNNNHQWYPGHTDEGHYLVALEQADGQWHLEQNINSGDGGDPYPGTTSNRTYDDNSTPDSRDYNFNTTDVAVRNISDSAPMMTGDLYVGAATLSGPLSGTLAPGCYHVIGEILVSSTDVLHLMPGTTLIFDGPYPFRIYGTLLAEGTESDSIVFTTYQSASNRWRGLRFQGPASSGSRLAYCLVEKGYAAGPYPDCSGGGASCYLSSPTFTNSVLADNWATDTGGGLYCEDNSSPTVTNCTISGNTAGNYAGGVGCYDSSPIFTNCILTGNRSNGPQGGGGVNCANSWATFTSCTISDNSANQNGGGIRCSYSWPSFVNCMISFNSAGTRGGGIYSTNDASPTFVNCSIAGNSAEIGGGGLQCEGSSPTLTNCTFAGNWCPELGRSGGVDCQNSSPTINSFIIAFSSGYGIYFNNSTSSEVQYGDFFGNSGGDIIFYNNNPSHGPLGIGQIVTTNANGDPCDVYYNIFCDPMFADAANDDYHLTAPSSCIDAANPCELDPDNTILDIGAYYYPHSMPDYDPSLEIYLWYQVMETGLYISWRPFGNATGYKVYRSTQVDLPLNEWQLLTTTPPETWEYFDSEAYDAAMRYFYRVVVVY
jgi:parallel beta-helix repeat protein/predicted outer membrane repeat protein